MEEPGDDIDSQVVDEDDIIIINLTAKDIDNDEISYFAEPLDLSFPVVCSINENQLTLEPAQNHNGVFDILVTAFDDSYFYETNTLIDDTTFELTINAINDVPIIVNSIDDIQILEGVFQDS